jgi:hypothetical protein
VLTRKATLTSLSGGILRVVHTFILRLLVDSAEPQALRGELRPVPEGEAQPFTNEQALLALLRRLASPPGEYPMTDEKWIENHSKPERREK